MSGEYGKGGAGVPMMDPRKTISLGRDLFAPVCAGLGGLQPLVTDVAAAWSWFLVNNLAH